MAAIAAVPGVSLPSRLAPGWAEELLNPRFAATYARAIGQRLGRVPRLQDSLVEAFWAASAGASVAGFKLILGQHHDVEAFLAEPGLAVVALLRTDLESAVASALCAEVRQHWPREGGPQTPWRYEERMAPRVHARVREHLYARRLLERVDAAVRLEYERMVTPDFECPGLDTLIGGPVRIARPRPPIRAADYVENLDALRACIAAALVAADVPAITAGQSGPDR